MQSLQGTSSTHQWSVSYLRDVILAAGIAAGFKEAAGAVSLQADNQTAACYQGTIAVVDMSCSLDPPAPVPPPPCQDFLSVSTFHITTFQIMFSSRFKAIGEDDSLRPEATAVLVSAPVLSQKIVKSYCCTCRLLNLHHAPSNGSSSCSHTILDTVQQVCTVTICVLRS